MKTFYFILPTVFLLQILCCCLPLGGWGLAYKHDLVENYSVWAADVNEQACIVKKEKSNSSSAGCVVPWMVFEYGWNDDFIIAKQHPVENKVDTTITNWYIIEVKNGNVHGPLTEKDFFDLRRSLKIPDKLSFIEIINP